MFLQKRKADFPELPTPLFGSAPQVYIKHLSVINSLRKYWQKGQSAVIIDDHVGDCFSNSPSNEHILFATTTMQTNSI